ncbi:MAG: right-handed parallel beta-helix repeat-containing protein [Saprospiraceae bacterium]
MKNQFLALLLFAIPQILIAQTTVSGTISENTSWTLTGSPYVIDGLVTVAQGVTLVIEPGVIIKRTGYSTQSSMWVSGTLIAVGNPAQPIVFTSHRDDSYGGDTNGDGSSTLPAAGDWSNIMISETGGNSQLEYCIFKYGGYVYQVANVATLQVRGSSPTVSNCLFSNCVRGVGVTHAGNPSLSGNHFEQCTDVPVIKDLTTQVSFENNTFSDNAFSGIGLVPRAHSGSGESYTLSKANLGNLANAPYIIPSTNVPIDGLSIEAGVSLTIEPGVVVKRSGSYAGIQSALTIRGTLIAQGTSTEPIIFTSIRDDEAGGDTNNDGNTTSPGNGDWANIKLLGNDGNSIMEYCIFKYGGYVYQVSNIAALQVSNGSPVISNCLFSKCVRGVGVTHAGNPSLSGNHFEQCTDVPVIKDLTTQVSFENNTFSGNAFSGIGLVPRAHSGSGESYTLSKANLGNLANAPYIIPSTNVPIDGLSIEAGVSLTIEPGIVIKRSGSYAGVQSAMTIRGTLIAQGTSTEPIIFTSIRDDEAGGDSNNDGNATVPNPGDWKGLFIASNNGTLSNLENCIFRFGGDGALTTEGNPAGKTHHNPSIFAR